MSKNAYVLHAIELVDGVCRMNGVGIYRELRDRRDKWETNQSTLRILSALPRTLGCGFA